jgi:hypothetical protein
LPPKTLSPSTMLMLPPPGHAAKDGAIEPHELAACV